MRTMSIFLPVPAKDFVDAQLSERGCGSSSEYMRQLLSKEQHRQQLRAALLAGGATLVVGEADAAYFDALRARVKRR
ncbi:MAG: type II toxin-antitoxin system ParD family antitoxin [Pseudomonadota bacterium]|nr:type II toxin-antitoxin system ParD family antitoxin [Pseudomonadota bacterium]